MADTSKAQKLASARKKFKELKKKKNATNRTSEERSVTQFIKEDTPVDSLTSSTHSSINEQGVEQPYNDNIQQNVSCPPNAEATQLPNYFNTTVHCPEPSSFFDNIVSDENRQNFDRENNQSDLNLFNNPTSCDDTNLNTFNSYSFQYDTPFNDTNTAVVQEETKNEDIIPAPEAVENYFHRPNDTSNVNTYFTENVQNDLGDTEIKNENLDLFDVNQHQNIKDKSPDKDTKDLIQFLGNKEKEIEEQYSSMAQSEHQYYSQQDTFFPNIEIRNQSSIQAFNTQTDDIIQKSQNTINAVENTPQNLESFQSEVYYPQSEAYNIQSIQNFSNNQIGDICNTSSEPSNNVNQMKVEEEEVPSQPISSMESLLQLSNQMAKLIEPSSEYTGQSETSELETRNLELAAELEKERIKSEQLTVGISEHQRRLAELENELKNKIAESNIIENDTFTRLKEELQSHIQTIGMLVAEKTEISANASQFELLAKQKTTECEELQNRLKASRSRVADLEKETSNLKEELSRYQNMEGEQSQNVIRMNDEFKKYKEEKEEMYQDLLEAREKLKTTFESNLNLQKQVQELNSHLSLANIKIQQLTITENQHVDGQVEKLVQEKFALERQVTDLTQTVRTIMKEREDSGVQYQQYTQQLNTQLTNLARKLEQLQYENEVLVAQEQNRIKHIGELERQLQNLQNDHINYSSNYSNQRSSGDYKKEYMLALDNFQTIQTKKAQVDEAYTKVSNEKDMLLKDLESKKQTISHLEDLVEQLRESQPDNTKLLAAMESDKVAAARAMSQNIELKKQLEGMQEVLMKLDNDKVELTEKLTKELKINETITEDLLKTKVHLGTLADAIEIKDKELSNIRNSSEELNKQILQQGQLTDRLRHYEAQNYSTNALQEQLQEANSTIVKLTAELDSFKSNRSVNAPVTSQNTTALTLESQNSETKSEHNKNSENLLIEELQEKLAKLEVRNQELEKKLENISNADAVDNNNKPEKDLSQNNGPTNILDKEEAMKHLEEKFLHTMEEIAKLTDEKQKLEHLVLQLQGETETIGEYVALYQHQRSVLKQKALEKDSQLRQLTKDRTQIKNKLDQLNTLVKKLVSENGTITSELLQHHEQLKNESQHLCEEHSRIHQEINKITEDSLSSSSDQHGNQSTETAERIIELLTEIKTSNLVQPTENFHHCPWCSGQLITV